MAFQHDTETRAITTALELLADLSPDAQQRIMDYLTSRFTTTAKPTTAKLTTFVQSAIADVPARRGGRPKGSKNKPATGGKRGPKPGAKQPGRPPLNPINTSLVPMSDLTD